MPGVEVWSWGVRSSSIEPVHIRFFHSSHISTSHRATPPIIINNWNVYNLYLYPSAISCGHPFLHCLHSAPVLSLATPPIVHFALDSESGIIGRLDLSTTLAEAFAPYTFVVYPNYPATTLFWISLRLSHFLSLSMCLQPLLLVKLIPCVQILTSSPFICLNFLAFHNCSSINSIQPYIQTHIISQIRDRHPQLHSHLVLFTIIADTDFLAGKYGYSPNTLIGFFVPA